MRGVGVGMMTKSDTNYFSHKKNYYHHVALLAYVIMHLGVIIRTRSSLD